MESAENQPQPNSDRESQTNTNPPRSKVETIALLNASIDKLESTIRRISEDSGQIPPTDSMDNLLTTAQELEDAVTAIEAKIAAPIAPEPTAPEAIAPEPIASATVPTQLPGSATTAEPTSAPAEKIAPKPKPKKKTALIISAVTAIAISIVTLFWLQPEFIADLLPKETVSAPKVAVSLDEATEKLVEQPTINPLQDEEIAASDADLGIVRDISAMDFPEEIESVAEPIEDVVEAVIPSELASPSKPKDLKMVTIKPKLNFTPEQNLVATLETKISELTNAQSELIENIQINPDRSLLVRVTDDWYELDEAAQNNLGNEILQRSRRFSFERLEVKDDQDILVARSPIIGNNIIILQSIKG